MSQPRPAAVTLARLKADLKTLAKYVQQEAEAEARDNPNAPGAFLLPGVLCGLGLVARLLKGDTIDQALTALETGMEAAVGRAYLDGKLTASSNAEGKPDA